MSARRDPDRLIHDFLKDGGTELADPVYDAVRATIVQKRQRVVIGPWRFPDMNKLVPIGLGAAAVVVALLAGGQLLRPPAQDGVGGAPAATPVPTVAPTPNPTPVPTATPAPTPSGPSAPPLTQSFTSKQHGISLSYPKGWTAKAATEPWSAGTSIFPFADPQARADFLYDTTLQDSLFLAIGSQPIGDSTPEDWIMEMGASVSDCPATEAITVGGASGRIGSEGSCHLAVVTTDGRGYWISLYGGGDNPAAVAPYDRAWFEEVLATVQLHPEDAVD